MYATQEFEMVLNTPLFLLSLLFPFFFHYFSTTLWTMLRSCFVQCYHSCSTISNESTLIEQPIQQSTTLIVSYKLIKYSFTNASILLLLYNFSHSFVTGLLWQMSPHPSVSIYNLNLWTQLIISNLKNQAHF